MKSEPGGTRLASSLRAFSGLFSATLMVFSIPPARALAQDAQFVADHGPLLWVGRGGEPLPFLNEDEILEFLREAAVLEAETIQEGINSAQRLLLEKGGIRLRSVFRKVQVYGRDADPGSAKRPLLDCHIYECAAYQVSRLIRLNRVPPVVRRRVNGVDGTLQLWVEGGVMEKELIEKNTPRPVTPAWQLQKQMMRVFDELIFNTDRHLGNILVDGSSTIWLIDHTRAFRSYTYLRYQKEMTLCERTVWQALKSLNERQLRETLTPYLKGGQISAVERRRQKLVRHFEELIEKQGEEAVIVDWP